MAVPLIPLLGFLFLCGFATYHFLVFPCYISPLAKIPNAHWSAPLSRLWILSKRCIEQETPAVHEAHKRFGPIVRIAPNELSVNSVDGGIRNVYSGGYEKGDWYLNIFSNYGVMPMFAMPDHGSHSKRKRMLSNIYAKSTLQSSSSMNAITEVLLKERFIPRLQQLARSGKPIEFYNIFCAITMDFVSAYVFGINNSSNLVEQREMGAKFFRDYKARQRYQFWPQDLPRFTQFMSSVGLLWMIVPNWVAKANRDIEAWILQMCDGAETTVREAELEEQTKKSGNWPNVYSQLRSALLKERKAMKGQDVSAEQMVQQHRLDIASEMLDHTLAGFDTSSITLTFLAWELSRPINLSWQQKLRHELESLKGSWDAKEIDNLPILSAILTETLRLHAPIPGNQPRITPPSATLGAPGHSVTDLPANVRVQAQAWSLHRDPNVFPSPEYWDPDRWLSSSESQLKEMQRWYWAFGSGGRMCVGSNLAILDMKAVITAIWSGFKTEVINDDGMVHNGGYVAEPMGKNGNYLVLRLVEDAIAGNGSAS